MAYLTFDPASNKLQGQLVANLELIRSRLQRELPKLGVADNDIVIKVLECHCGGVTEDHVEVILKTDNPKVDSPAIVAMLSDIFVKIPFEVTRIPCGYWVVEMLYEIHAFIFRKRRNWASNYQN